MRVHTTIRAALLVSMLAVVMACPRAAVAGDAIDTAAALRDVLLQDDQPAPLAAFYEARKFAPAWTGSDQALIHAMEAREVLAHADAQGLRTEDYAFWAKWDAPPTEPRQAARYDIAVTRAVMLYALDVRTGRFRPRSVYENVQLPPPSFDLVREINRGLSRDSFAPFLASLPPPDVAYRTLVAALGRYRMIAAAGGWPRVVTSSQQSLTRRLALEDPKLARDDDPDDEAVAAALRRYEARNGFEANPKLTPEVVAALNITVQTRMAEIAANLERRRWIPRKLEERYIAVNVADQSLDFMDDGEVLLHSRVVVGKPQTQTPILRTLVKAVVLNPPWDIPDFIAAKSLLPQLKKNRNYLATRNIVLADGPADDPHGQKIDWRKVTAKTIPYQIQQLPGGDNALGTVMLDMPNDFDVYLHDTPHKELFEQTSRTRSNGCIRVEKIEQLTSLVLGDEADDDEIDDLRQRIAKGATVRLALDKPVPVYLFDWTALPQADGTVGFRPDRYGRDKRLAGLFASAGARELKAPVARKKNTTQLSSRRAAVD
jgi:murein L,D-transpeptidase YcbB/YkuD